MTMTDKRTRQLKLVIEENTLVKRPQVNVALGYPLYDEVKVAVQTEPVDGMGQFVRALARYGWRAYREVGSLKALKALETTASTQLTSKRISAERCAMLAEALNLILERGNSAIIEAVERYLIDKAGRFGDLRK